MTLAEGMKWNFEDIQVAFPFYCHLCKTLLCPEKGNTAKDIVPVLILPQARNIKNLVRKITLLPGDILAWQCGYNAPISAVAFTDIISGVI